MIFGAYLLAFVGGFGVFFFFGGVFGGGHVDIKAISFNTIDCGEQTHGKNTTTNPRQASLTLWCSAHMQNLYSREPLSIN